MRWLFAHLVACGLSVALSLTARPSVAAEAREEYKGPYPERSGVHFGLTLDWVYWNRPSPFNHSMRLGYAVSQEVVLSAMLTAWTEWRTDLVGEAVVGVEPLYFVTMQYWPVEPVWLRFGPGLLAQERAAWFTALGVDLASSRQHVFSVGTSFHTVYYQDFRYAWQIELGWSVY
jgi:hypothetical protein